MRTGPCESSFKTKISFEYDSTITNSKGPSLGYCELIQWVKSQSMQEKLERWLAAVLSQVSKTICWNGTFEIQIRFSHSHYHLVKLVYLAACFSTLQHFSYFSY